jgi:hypothetical protein
MDIWFSQPRVCTFLAVCAYFLTVLFAHRSGGPALATTVSIRFDASHGLWSTPSLILTSTVSVQAAVLI